MAQKRGQRLTPLELEIMNILWESGASNVQTVREQLERELAYTTVQTMLNILHRKGRVKRTLKDRAYVYKPAMTRPQFVSRHLGDLVDVLFGGSDENLVMSSVGAKHRARQKLDRLYNIRNE